jgi:hypothetical protein
MSLRLRLIVLAPLVVPSLLTLWLPYHPGGVVAHGPKVLALGAFLGQLLVAPVAQIAVVLLYRHLCVRREGVDIHTAVAGTPSRAPVPSGNARLSMTRATRDRGMADTVHVLKVVQE